MTPEHHSGGKERKTKTDKEPKFSIQLRRSFNSRLCSTGIISCCSLHVYIDYSKMLDITSYPAKLIARRRFLPRMIDITSHPAKLNSKVQVLADCQSWYNIISKNGRLRRCILYSGLSPIGDVVHTPHSVFL